MYNRNSYLNALVQSLDNKMIKVITGPRRAGKSFLLFHIFKNYLLKQGVREEQIIEVDLEKLSNAALRNPLNLSEHIKSRLTDNQSYVIIDEIQLCKAIKNPAFSKEIMPEGEEIPEITFYDALNELNHNDHVQIFVTGSNAHMLSEDIATEFRGRGFSIPVHPLTFSEYVGEERNPADLMGLWEEYYRYGGLPVCCDLPDIPSKRKYLSEVFETMYIKDVIERNSLRSNTDIREVCKVVASSIGSLVNYSNITNTFLSVEHNKTLTDKTVKQYIQYLKNAFVVSAAERYDVKGRQNIGGLVKYYFCDMGIRNAALGFKETDEESHSMENVVYNELIARGYTVHVGIINWKEIIEGRAKMKNAEVDFVAEKGGAKFYIQVAIDTKTETKLQQEKTSLSHITDSFLKILITKTYGTPGYDDDGVLHVSILDFLLKPQLLPDLTLV